jgi:hypothetical protein
MYEKKEMFLNSVITHKSLIKSMKVTEILSNFNLFHGIKKMEIKSEKVA